MICSPQHISTIASWTPLCYPEISVKEAGAELQAWNLHAEKPDKLVEAMVPSIPPSPIPFPLSVEQKIGLLAVFYNHCSQNPDFLASGAARWVIHLMGEFSKEINPAFQMIELKKWIPADEMRPDSIVPNARDRGIE